MCRTLSCLLAASVLAFAGCAHSRSGSNDPLVTPPASQPQWTPAPAAPKAAEPKPAPTLLPPALPAPAPTEATTKTPAPAPLSGNPETPQSETRQPMVPGSEPPSAYVVPFQPLTILCVVGAAALLAGAFFFLKRKNSN